MPVELAQSQGRAPAGETRGLDYPGVVGPDRTAQWFAQRVCEPSVPHWGQWLYFPVALPTIEHRQIEGWATVEGGLLPRASLRRKFWSAGTETGEARSRATGLGLANVPAL